VVRDPVVRLSMRSVLLSFALLLPGVAAAQDAPPLAAWMKEIKTPAHAPFPYKIVAVKKIPKKGDEPDFAGFDIEDVEKLTYLRVADPQSVAWNYKLNEETYAEKEPLAALLLASGADTVLVAPEKGKWELVQLKDGKPEVLVTAPAPKGSRASDLAKWLPGALGWDGVVLAEKGEFLLVGSTSQILVTPEIQALAVSGSAGNFALAADRQGAGLLSLSEKEGGYGVFDVVFLAQDLKTLPVGTKLIIERKKK